MKLIVSLQGKVHQQLELDPSREYLIGRGEGNHIELEKFPGISRRHMRVVNVNQRWQVEVLSKIESFFVNGEPVGHLVLEEGSQFSLGPYSFTIAQEQAMPIAVGESGGEGQVVPAPPEVSAVVTADDNTAIARTTGAPFIRIYSEALRVDRMLRLEGSAWVGGRDKSCAIALEDAHCSRRHFEITATPQGYFVTDLESANGTFVNGQKLRAGDPWRLNPGDKISVSQTQIQFEIRDTEFQRRLELVPQEVLAQKSIEVKEEREEWVVPAAPEVQSNDISNEYAKQLAAYSAYYKEYFQKYEEEIATATNTVSYSKKKRILVFATVALLLIAVVAFFAMPTKKGPSKQASNPSDPFSMLLPEQQTLIKDSYQLAKDLITHRKYVMAQDELNKIHQLLPSGYKDSLQLAAEAKRAIEVRRDAEEIERIKREKEEMARKVEEIISKCKASIQPKTTAEEIRACLQPAIEMDPENSELKALLALVDSAQREREEEMRNKATQRSRVQALEALCRRADDPKLEDDEQALRKALQACIASKLPDPRKLREEAQRRLEALDKSIEERVALHLTNAEAAYQRKEYRTAMIEIRRIRRLKARHKPALALMDKIEADTNLQMKNLYNDSILEESYGKIELAKEKWNKIIEMGLFESDYHKRAVRKLQRYGVQ